MSMSQVVYMGPYLQFTKPIEVSELVDEVERLSQGRLTIVLGEDNKVVLIVANRKDYKKFGVQVLHQDDIGGLPSRQWVVDPER